MIFVFSQDDRGLDIYTTEKDAIQSCEGIDVEDENYLFFDDSGYPLTAVFTTPNKRGKFMVESGVYRLQPTAEGERMLEVLNRVTYLGANNSFSSIEDVRNHLISTNTESDE